MNSRSFSRYCQACWIFMLCAVLLSASFAGCTPVQKPEPAPQSSLHNTLTKAEKEAGWVLLFNGHDFSGWRGLGSNLVPAGQWEIENNSIKKVPSREVALQPDGQPLEGGDLITYEVYSDFELCLEWKIGPAGNSGIKYNVDEQMSSSYPPQYAALGFEFQILDDQGHPDAKASATHTAGALYDILEPEGKVLKAVGEFNSLRIVFDGGHGEHWLNGIKVLEYDLGTPGMEQRLEKSKYRSIPGFADKRAGHIVLQNHTDVAWFRNIKIRKITH